MELTNRARVLLSLASLSFTLFALYSCVFCLIKSNKACWRSKRGKLSRRETSIRKVAASFRLTSTRPPVYERAGTHSFFCFPCTCTASRVVRRGKSVEGPPHASFPGRHHLCTAPASGDGTFPENRRPGEVAPCRIRRLRIMGAILVDSVAR